MDDDLKKLGALFRQKRMESGLSLKEVENSTSIRANFLEAIEKGQSEAFLSSIYILGFIRQYATFLGFDVEEVSRNYPKAFLRPEEKHDFAYGIGTLEMRGSASGGVRWLPNLVWAGIAAAALLGAYFIVRLLGIF